MKNHAISFALLTRLSQPRISHKLTFVALLSAYELLTQTDQ